MKMREAMTKADGLRETKLTEQQKAGFLQDLDAKFAEFMEVNVPEDIWPEDRDLLMPAPYDDVYPCYLVAMYDYYNGETDLYMNDMEVYNTRLRDARAWWRRNHRPSPGGNWKVF